MKALAELAEGERMDIEGPISISGTDQITYRHSVRRTAACYFAAFESGRQAFPYFTEE
jgi:hypothetical protein